MHGMTFILSGIFPNKVTQKDTPLAAQQITSVGQSQERTINTSFKLSSNVSASVTIPASLKTSIEAGLASEITQSISTKYSGPAVGSGISFLCFQDYSFCKSRNMDCNG